MKMCQIINDSLSISHVTRRLQRLDLFTPLLEKKFPQVPTQAAASYARDRCR